MPLGSAHRLAPEATFLDPEPERDAAAIEADAVLRHVGAQLARFKIPRDVVFVDSLPRNALGKVQHFRLREMAATGTSHGGG